jgi:hypothetical protein
MYTHFSDFSDIVPWFVELEGQEKYLREPSITPVRCPTGTILHGENEVFQTNRNDFPKVSFSLDVI